MSYFHTQNMFRFSFLYPWFNILIRLLLITKKYLIIYVGMTNFEQYNAIWNNKKTKFTLNLLNILNNLENKYLYVFYSSSNLFYMQMVHKVIHTDRPEDIAKKQKVEHGIELERRAWGGTILSRHLKTPLTYREQLLFMAVQNCLTLWQGALKKRRKREELGNGY